MYEKKYELYGEPIGNPNIYRIKALKSFNDVKKGDIGGYVESYSNLSQEGDCWIYDDAKAINDSRVEGNAQLHDLSTVMNDACVSEDAIITDTSMVCGNAKICGSAKIKSGALVCCSSVVTDNATVDNSTIILDAIIRDFSYIAQEATIGRGVRTSGHTVIHSATIMSTDPKSFIEIDESDISGGLINIICCCNCGIIDIRRSIIHGSLIYIYSDSYKGLDVKDTCINLSDNRYAYIDKSLISKNIMYSIDTDIGILPSLKIFFNDIISRFICKIRKIKRRLFGV